MEENRKNIITDDFFGCKKQIEISNNFLVNNRKDFLFDEGKNKLPIPVLCVACISPQVGRRRSRFLRESVEELRKRLREIGGDLLVAVEVGSCAL